MSATDEQSMLLEVSSMEEAQDLAAARWDIRTDDVMVVSVEEEKKLFGLFGKRLKVAVRPKADLVSLKARDFLCELFELMDLRVEVEVKEGDVLDITGEDAGIVIGRHGDTLKALEHLLNLAVRREGSRLRLDSEGYRQRREASLKRLAESAARRALERGRPVPLEPMANWERKVVHLTLKDYHDIETRSVGDEPYRHIVVWPRRLERKKPSFYRT